MLVGTAVSVGAVGVSEAVGVSVDVSAAGANSAPVDIMSPKDDGVGVDFLPLLRRFLELFFLPLTGDTVGTSVDVGVLVLVLCEVA